ncbi:helix-turn-helix domain-containing protein [Alkaliphilus transvaalensis]|uniref:helix-turn-helix domain-containing protein n=1 Tax=Alkaliphilus transvaalensis TaxID=114628 RepID=UPI00047BAD6E|nr:helix-turn-helix domain-containing protein [Alkaliphilus transvaalensis]
MRKVNDSKRLNDFIKQYSINQLFTKDMTSIMELFLFKKNDYICRESEKMHYIYFFVEGRAKVYTTLSNGKSLLLCFYEGFKILGDVEFCGIENASSNVQVVNDAYCIGIAMEKAKVNLIEDAKFLRYICSSLGNKLNRCSKNSSINLLYPLENRLASYILAIGERLDDKDDYKIEVYENFSELAELLGTSYRHLLRTINQLTDKRIIKKNRSSIEVINRKELEELAADLYK